MDSQILDNLFESKVIKKDQIQSDLKQIKEQLLAILTNDNSDEKLKAINLIIKIKEQLRDIFVSDFKNDKDLISVGCQCLLKDNIKSNDNKYLAAQIQLLVQCNLEQLNRKDFIQEIMETLEDISDEKVFSNIIHLIVEIIIFENTNKNLSNHLQQNVLFQTMMEHKNNRYFKEYLIHLLNLGQENQIEKTMQFIKLVFTNNVDEFFYSNDLKIVFDVQLAEIQNVVSETKRNLYLELILLIVKTNQYEIIEYHRKDELNEILDDLMYNDISTLNQEVITQIQKITL